MAPENSTSNSTKSPLKLLVFLGLGILVLVLSYVLVFRKGNTTNISDSKSVSPVEVDLGYDPATSVPVKLETQFMPQTVTIKVGQSVTWTNNSGKTATVNSSPHPEHTDNPFLNLGEFSGSDSFTLVFTEAGTFRYHNHLNPSQFGTVNVE